MNTTDKVLYAICCIGLILGGYQITALLAKFLPIDVNLCVVFICLFLFSFVWLTRHLYDHKD